MPISSLFLKIKTLFKKPNSKVEAKLQRIKSVTIYISDLKRQIIIAPRYFNNAGILYEQDTCTLLTFPVDYFQLGNEMLRNFDMFTLKDQNLREYKLTDWPAYKCSKLKSVKSFKDLYHRIDIDGNNESNIIISIESPVSGDKDLFIKATISTSNRKEAIGELVMKVYQKAFSGK